VVSQNFRELNQLQDWLRRIDQLKRAA